jgi:flagellar FliL protein
MAEVPVLEAAEEAPAAAGKSKKWLIIGMTACVALAGGGAGAYFLMGQANHTQKTQDKAKEPLAPPIYVALDPPFVVNFEGDQLVRFLQVTVQVMTRDPATVEVLKANDPVVRNDLLLLLANQQYDVVATRSGKEKLRADTLAAIRHVIDSSGGKATNIEQVYFTSFVMQ